ncbi:Type 1 glutamine amidotransferase-like domain-containing protein [Streptococcus mutans]|uniref:Type 1 glutamine amidotransferase-like domain-containing protein n=1 Tax=Streptococcus mutans TaxID=1309 RepID=UPI001455A361|nr:Type 1 glutamine amidotransferase-like domain-containing protein [Streptococcus mutans]MCY7123090.1 Type 1 glutamine amidotransferase-like domain-containing protein [Streptococcus mutans]NLR04253.1 peptidase S51 [Streptococcus mutans]
MKTLFLCSYFTDVASLFKTFADQNQFEKKVLFIPTAGNVEEYTAYIDEARAVFADLQFEVEVLDITEVREDVVREKISQTPCLYISGGNTFYLLQELKKKNLLPLIRERIHQGMVYLGESAGAIIASRDIFYNHIMDDKNLAPGLTEYSALSMVDFFVLPHWKEFPFEESSQQTAAAYDSQLKLLKLTNQQAVLVTGHTNVIENAQ